MNAGSVGAELDLVYRWCEDNAPSLPLLQNAGLPLATSPDGAELLGAFQHEILAMFATHDGEFQGQPTLLPDYRLLSFTEAMSLNHELCAVDWHFSPNGNSTLYSGYTRSQIENVGYALPDDVFLIDEDGQSVHFEGGAEALSPSQRLAWEEQEFRHLGETLAFLSGPPKQRTSASNSERTGFFPHYFPIADWNGHLIVVNTISGQVSGWSPEGGLASAFSWASFFDFVQNLRIALTNRGLFMAMCPEPKNRALVWT